MVIESLLIAGVLLVGICSAPSLFLLNKFLKLQSVVQNLTHKVGKYQHALKEFEGRFNGVDQKCSLLLEHRHLQEKFDGKKYLEELDKYGALGVVVPPIDGGI